MDRAEAEAVLLRLGVFLDQFAACFGRRAQRHGASRYVQGLLNDSERKSIQALHGRLSDPGAYQGLQHFITHSPWDAGPGWRQLRTTVPVPRGLLLLDETSFPKQGRHSVGVARQYCGALGKTANCQVAVSTIVVADGLSWPTSMELYLPREWTDDRDRCAAAGIPTSVRFQEKWRIGLRHIRQVRATGITIEAALGDAEYGKVSAFRTALARMGLRYALGIPNFLAVWTPGARAARPVRALLAPLPRTAWRRVCWGQGSRGPLAARFTALRVRPAKSRRECWWLCERPRAGPDEPKHYFINAPATWSLRQLVQLAHGRWQIEQHYQELKSELGLDHFEGRSYRGWQHHALLAAVTYAFLQLERRRHPHTLPTFPAIRHLVREIFAALFFVTQPDWLELLVSFQRNPPLRI